MNIQKLAVQIFEDLSFSDSWGFHENILVSDERSQH
jgi:hypothetical protein